MVGLVIIVVVEGFVDLVLVVSAALHTALSGVSIVGSEARVVVVWLKCVLWSGAAVRCCAGCGYWVCVLLVVVVVVVVVVVMVSLVVCRRLLVTGCCCLLLPPVVVRNLFCLSIGVQHQTVDVRSDTWMIEGSLCRTDF